MEKLAIISDIHGNVTALQAVLSDIQERGIGRIVCLGDLVGKGPRSDRTVDICNEACETVIRGNWDEGITNESDREFVIWIQKQIGTERIEYLRNLPLSLDLEFAGRKVRLYHASHLGPNHRIHSTAPIEDHLAMFTNTEFTGQGPEPDIVGYGDIHASYMKCFKHKILFNAGSVGNPLDLTLATYTILEEGPGGSFTLSFPRIPYDVEAEVATASELGMPFTDAYADELRTGRYRGSKN